MNNLFMLLVVGLLSILAFWKNSMILFILIVPVAMTLGLSIANDNDPGTALWISGTVIALYGTWCIFKVALWGLGILDRRRNKGG